MGLPLKQVEAEALELPIQQRAQLVKRLIESLDAEAQEDPAVVEQAWEDEIRRRVAEMEAGTAEFFPAEQVFAELRRPSRS